jgi:hypothetical protein
MGKNFLSQVLRYLSYHLVNQYVKLSQLSDNRVFRT